jgi:LPXTG-motif cell wall-anchored protein
LGKKTFVYLVLLFLVLFSFKGNVAFSEAVNRGDIFGVFIEIEGNSNGKETNGDIYIVLPKSYNEIGNQIDINLYKDEPRILSNGDYIKKIDYSVLNVPVTNLDKSELTSKEYTPVTYQNGELNYSNIDEVTVLKIVIKFSELKSSKPITIGVPVQVSPDIPVNYSRLGSIINTRGYFPIKDDPIVVDTPIELEPSKVEPSSTKPSSTESSAIESSSSESSSSESSSSESSSSESSSSESSSSESSSSESSSSESSSSESSSTEPSSTEPSSSESSSSESSSSEPSSSESSGRGSTGSTGFRSTEPSSVEPSSTESSSTEPNSTETSTCESGNTKSSSTVPRKNESSSRHRRKSLPKTGEKQSIWIEGIGICILSSLVLLKIKKR